ncbi:AraC family transcriptional regulator [Colwellia sp. UCD-KL20]|uniref:AraC family transcriptional regulator n=1 Tax=Colwellia sp. UCD-KL20 TaxID=1917165 RepID=UPI000970A69A|nr:AraC family transcriptional regulator [Colwellia sp. UCD-KL20]
MSKALMGKQRKVELKNNFNDIRLIIPIFLLDKLKVHPLTEGMYPISLGKSQNNFYQIQQKRTSSHWLIYSLTDHGVLHYKNKVRKLKRGDLVVISPNEAFEYKLQIENKKNIKIAHKNALFWINFDGCLADYFAQRLLMKMDDGVAHVGALTNISNDFDELLELGSRGYTATNVIHAVHVLQQSLSFLALQLRLTSFNNNSSFNLNDVETLMQNNLHQELSLDALAHHSQLSKFHFLKKFKELTDSSPIQHFINMKIQRACFYLDNSEKNIKSIGEELGYADPYYFSRLFKKVIGMSPKQYRESRHS